MSIYLLLFLVFFKISLFTIGGGAAMIPIVQQEVLSHNWLTEDMFINLVGIAESTPGPIAINTATYVGATQAGFLGAVCATIGIVTPPFLIIIVIAKFFKNFLNNKYVNVALEGTKPVIIGLIISVGIYFALKSIFPAFNTGDFTFDWRAFLLFFLLLIINFAFKHYKKKNISPILLIIISAVLGMIIYIK